MKTIEERIEEITEKWENMPNPYGSSVIDSALRELAADLNAEKEKEVSELKKKLATLAKDYSEVVAGESEMEELTKLRSLLDEVKRVLGAVAGCKLFYEESMDIDNHTTADVNNLLTRLGSHE